MKTVMFYQTATDAVSLASSHFPAHRARLDEFHRRGVLLMAGPFALLEQGAMGIFTARNAAEEFISGDPFVMHGVVAKYTLQDWNEVLA